MKPIEISERYTLTQIIVRKLKQYMLEQKLAPGDKLPAERELCKIVGVSRSILREALRALESRGLLEIRHGEGSFVADFSLHALYEQLSFLQQADQGHRSEMNALRYWLEAAALDNLDLSTNHVRTELLALHEQYRRAIAIGPDEAAALDAQFHTAVVASSGNRMLVSLADVFLKLSEEETPSLHDASCAEEHGAYLKALLQGNAVRARELLRAHLNR